MLYFDFDGVILDTEFLIFEDWRKNRDKYKKLGWDKIKYLKNVDWEYVLNNSKIINDSIYYLKQIDPEESFILTKIHSLENEGAKKVKWSRARDIKQPIILVPYNLDKTNIVNAKGNVLVDDSLNNLDDWDKCGGQSVFFDIDNDNYDSWHLPNIKEYERVMSLSKFIK